MKREIDWKKYPVRVCQSLHTCELCGCNIKYGSSYRDGGYGRRAHDSCVRFATPESIGAGEHISQQINCADGLSPNA